ncbi:co-chaperone GroES [Patescibacteria group bacterium]|nr:co-chaperone GroES [Patescibacteria group bacterium]
MKKKTKKKVVKAAKKTVKKVVKPSVQKNTLGTPYGDRVLVKPKAAEEMTSFGIIIPDSSKEKPEQGVVVAVGEGKISNDGKILPMRVKVGDTIMFNKYGYDEVKIDGTEYYLIREDNISYIL